MKKNRKEQSGMSAVFTQSAIVGLISAILIGIAQPIYMLIAKTGVFEYNVSRFILGSVYGWILGVGNFLAMGVSLYYVTMETRERKEGQLRARGFYSVRLILLVVLSVVGCIIPIFHPVAVLMALVLTQLGITGYALVFKAKEAKATMKLQREQALKQEIAEDRVSDNTKETGENSEENEKNDIENESNPSES